MGAELSTTTMRSMRGRHLARASGVATAQVEQRGDPVLHRLDQLALPGLARCEGASRQTSCMLICMQSTSVRIDVATHEQLRRLASELQTTVGNTVTLAVRALRQDRIGEELAQPLRHDEVAWLDAESG